MNPNIQVDELDTLILRKIHKLTATQESAIKLLQQLKLLPLLPTTNKPCDAKNNHAWYLAEYNRLKDGE
jgi:hypothetical protein